MKLHSLSRCKCSMKKIERLFIESWSGSAGYAAKILTKDVRRVNFEHPQTISRPHISHAI